MSITGGCRCGAVRYSIEAEPITARHCWCRDCQYIGAGSGTVNVFFPSEAVKVEGTFFADYNGIALGGSGSFVINDGSDTPRVDAAPIQKEPEVQHLIEGESKLFDIRREALW